MSGSYALSLAAGIVLGLLFRAMSISAERKKEVTSWADFVTIRIVLPIHVLLSTQVSTEFPASLFIALGIGALLPLVTYAAGRALTVMGTSSAATSLPLVGATFGGGNRGILLLSLLLAFHVAPEFQARTASEPTLYDFFAVMDLAYFITFLAVVPPIHYATTGIESLRAQSLVAQVLSAAIVLASFALALFGAKLLEAAFWGDTRSYLGLFVTTVCTALVLVHAKFEFSPNVFKGIVHVLTARFFAICGLLLAAALITERAAELLLIAISLGIFLIVPPSSYAPSIIGRYQGQTEVEDAATLALTWNIVYLVVVAGVLLGGIVRVLTTLAA